MPRLMHIKRKAYMLYGVISTFLYDDKSARALQMGKKHKGICNENWVLGMHSYVNSVYIPNEKHLIDFSINCKI